MSTPFRLPIPGTKNMSVWFKSYFVPMAEALLGWFGGTSVEDTRWCQGMAVIMTSSGSDGWPGGQVAGSE